MVLAIVLALSPWGHSAAGAQDVMPPSTAGRACVIVVTGAPGAPEYGAEFERAASLWKAAAARGDADFVRIGGDPSGEGTAASDLDRIRVNLSERVGSSGGEPLWLILLGHGTSDGRVARFNLRGPDLSADDLHAWLEPIRRPVAILDGSSASGPFLAKLSGPNRIVVTATRSGDEQSFARFGQLLAESIADPASDLDKDEQVSLLEAFVRAGAQTAEFYRSRSRLASEHALLDDNGDRLGTPADWFRGIRPEKRPKTGALPDGTRAHQLHLVRNDREKRLTPEQRQRRDTIEQQLAVLRDRKGTLSEAEYLTQLEPLMLELGHLYLDGS
jgi:hypothetical protein